MTPQEIIDEVRILIQDTDATTPRYTDSTLVGFVNQTLKRMAVVRPDLFAYIGEIPLSDGEVVHTAPSDSIRVFEIFRVKNGGSIREVSREMMDQSAPSWQADTAGACTNWMRHSRNPNRFFTYPASTTSQIVIGEYGQTPPTVAIGDTITLIPDVWFPVIVDGVMWLAESIDDEHVNSKRAQMFQQAFITALQVNLESRAVTDSERGGLDEKDHR